MSTSALITLHGLKSLNSHSPMDTATLRRHWDGDMDRTMAKFLYAAMDNQHNAKGGYFDAFMCADPSEVCLHDFCEYTNDECFEEFHYHFNCETLDLIVHHEPFQEAQREVFRGSIALFINQYSGEEKAVISYDQYAPDRQTCLTREGMIRTVNKCFADIQRLDSPLNPNHKNWCKTVDRFLIILDEMKLSKEAREWRSSSMELSMGYANLTEMKENMQRRQALKDEINTTRVMVGDQPVAITILE